MKTKDVISQEELNEMDIPEVIDSDSDVRNRIILIRNELNALESSINNYDDRKKKSMKKKLDKIMNEIIGIRKI